MRSPAGCLSRLSQSVTRCFAHTEVAQGRCLRFGGWEHNYSVLSFLCYLILMMCVTTSGSQCRRAVYMEAQWRGKMTREDDLKLWG